MNNELTNQITNAYKKMEESGRASARDTSQLRKSIPKDEQKFSENVQFREAYMNQLNIKDHTPIIGGQSKEPEKQISENLMSHYLKNL